MLELTVVQEYMTSCGISTRILPHEGIDCVVHRLPGYKNNTLTREAMVDIAHIVEAMKDIDVEMFVVEDFVVIKNK